MANSFEVNPEPRADVIRELRALARRGATVRELDALVRSRMGYRPDNVIGVIWYFKHAYCLPLVTLLPLQGWCGSTEDEEINELLLPAIRGTMAQWDTENLPNGDEGRAESGKLVATEHQG